MSEHLSFARPDVDRVHVEAGVEEADLAPLKALHDRGFDVFMHGSGITGRLGEGSDLDYAVVGSLANGTIPVLNDMFGMTMPHELAGRVDYVSTNYRAANGRKMSVHIEDASFREGYGARPYAVEYRPARNAKPGGISSYMVLAAGEGGDVFLLDLLCQQQQAEGGVLTYTPQMGMVHAQGDRVIVPGAEGAISFQARSINYFDQAAGEVLPCQLDQTIMLGGLEFNKIVSDTLVFPSHNGALHDYVHSPLSRGMQNLAEFTKGDPVLYYILGFSTQTLARGRSLSQQFVQKLEQRLRGLVA